MRVLPTNDVMDFIIQFYSTAASLLSKEIDVLILLNNVIPLNGQLIY